jgi:dTDP-4-dehydrorhamnose 3,5-epimerase-like enzyme
MTNRIHVHPISKLHDNRGSFMEVFRLAWFADKHNFSPVQVNMSVSKKDVLRGLHYHKRQTDVWFPISGLFQAAFIYDLFTPFPRVVTMELNGESPQAILIPPNVAHGYLALTDNAVMGYAVDQYYNPEDEHTLWYGGYDIPWRVPAVILSDRDILASPANQPPKQEVPNQSNMRDSSAPAGDASLLCKRCKKQVEELFTTTTESKWCMRCVNEVYFKIRGDT